jgi:CDP-6-deoxy-D-xylo-4-hexulose-3-dehydrase
MSKNKILDDVRRYADEKLEPKPFVPGKTKIPASSPSLSSDDVASLAEAVLNLWYTEGKSCREFRFALSTLFNKNKVTLCNSGSSASLLAMKSAIDSFSYGEYVLTCGTAFPTTVSPIYQCGKIPIYIDIEPETLAPDMQQMADVVSKYHDKLCGAIFTHTLGFPYDEKTSHEILRHNSAFLISDCCDALGATLPGDLHVGRYADISTASFFPAHHITTGEGGAVITDDPVLHKVIQSNSNWGRDCHCAPGQTDTCGRRFTYVWDKMPEGYDHKYTFTRLGYNLKMTDLQAALGVSQIKRLSTFVEERQKNRKYLHNNLVAFWEYLSFPYSNIGIPSPFGFPIMVNTDAFDVRELINFLEFHKIATRRVFAGNITRQPGFRKLPKIAFDLSNSDKVMEDMFWIGCHPGITKEMMDYMIGTFDVFFKEKGL